jgi:hypothetical protein
MSAVSTDFGEFVPPTPEPRIVQVRVVKPFYLDGQRCEIGASVLVSKFMAEDLEGRGRAEIEFLNADA